MRPTANLVMTINPSGKKLHPSQLQMVKKMYLTKNKIIFVGVAFFKAEVITGQNIYYTFLPPPTEGIVRHLI